MTTPDALQEGELIIPLSDLVGPEGGAIMQITKLYEQALREAKRFEAENTRLQGENDLIARQRDAARSDHISARRAANRSRAALEVAILELAATRASKRTQKTNAKRARGLLREARIEAERLRVERDDWENIARVMGGRVTELLRERVTELVARVRQEIGKQVLDATQMYEPRDRPDDS